MASRWPLLVLFGPPVAWFAIAGAGLARAWLEPPLPPVERRGEAIAGSSACRGCHPAQYETWHASYHRTMTQRVEQAAVLAPFEGETLDRLGFRATMDRDDEGRPRVRVHRIDSGEPVLAATVTLTVGSHRIQQYVARRGEGGELRRLPIAWHIGEARWIHLGDAFLWPDGVPGSVEDYLRHDTRWNDNCVLCHNTEPVPAPRDDGGWATHVGEIGIACEACHGPAATHVERQSPMFRRLLGREHDAAITHPGTLAPAREVDVCGRCHGNRIAADLDAVLREGEAFVPGQPLCEGSRPIWRDASLGELEAPFAARFWSDGTPRLSAYEYQALQLSPCHAQGGLKCGDCHTMHGEHPEMQLRADWSPTRTCNGCHADTPAHGDHAPEQATCVECHMPRITYGLIQGMMSHRITVPDPASTGDKPDACTLCHVDQRRGWAADAIGQDQPVADPLAPVASAVQLELLGGDPIARAIAAHALGRERAAAPPRWRLVALADALEDEYPAVRWIAWRSAKRVASSLDEPELIRRLEALDPADRPIARIALTEWLHEHWGHSGITDEHRIELEARRDAVAIEIGE